MKPVSIAIIGGGTAGWMAANLFAKKWADKNVVISLVESPDIGIIGVGEGSTPTLKRFFEILEVSEREWMPACNATYKLNIRFKDWSPQSGIESYSHPFTSQVDTFTSRSFHVNTQTRRLGLDTHVVPEDFFINGVLAKQGKGPVTPENFPFKMEYGYHFDSGLLCQFLAKFAADKGVNHIQANVLEATRHQNGDIASVITKEQGEISADFFVDCTGFNALLMEKTLGVEFKSYKDNLFNDSAVVMPTPIDEMIPVETLATALSAGWVWKIPLTNRYGNGYVYSSDFISSDQAETEFRRHLNAIDSDEMCNHLQMKVGCLVKHWAHNCLSIGLSQGFIEPLEATALHLVQLSLEMFIEQFEKGGFSNQYQAQYNQFTAERFERVRDYIVAHYKMNTRNDSDYWRANRDNTHLSDSLIQLLNVWFNREDLTQEILRQNLQSHFDTSSWHCLLAGYGAFPPLADNQPNRGDLYRDNNIAQFLQGCALNFQSHATHLQFK
ncbi:tryptophan 7-halogenase [Thalassotalea sp. LPB0316]|uniref:tryptophan halogenase family protein n=1 Tax=Thalassotalea sp. LPB0316 TaxID=2769490 RepID=UPI001868E9E9|nr:tryptophan halogenase family protein [Thalassotalea sp. LPB0316]QOL26775.1 tryptophan 7-halogenase [Thalassotalea sp. LPB0316]